MSQSTYIRRLVIGSLRADLFWVRTVIRLDLEWAGCLSFEGMQVVNKFREQLRLAGLTRDEKRRLKL